MKNYQQSNQKIEKPCLLAANFVRQLHQQTTFTKMRFDLSFAKKTNPGGCNFKGNICCHAKPLYHGICFTLIHIMRKWFSDWGRTF